MRRNGGSKWVKVGLAVMLSVHALGTQAFASVTQSVPEISPGSISGGLALLAGGILVLRARRRSK
jgi:hypothetical protein